MSYAAGANGAHGLRRTTDDKRKAVTTLLADPEWAGWSNIAIAKACGVSDHFVGTIRKAHSDQIGVTKPADRTFTTKHGTPATMKTANIGKTRKAKEKAAPAQPSEPPSEVATPGLTPEQGAVAVRFAAAGPCRRWHLSRRCDVLPAWPRRLPALGRGLRAECIGSTWSSSRHV